MKIQEKYRLGVFFGGESSEHEISCLSAASVLRALSPERYLVTPVGITREGLWYIYRGPVEKIASGDWVQDAEHLTPAVLSPCKAQHGLLVFDKEKGTYQTEELDCIFPVMHGENSEDGRLQGLLALSGVPYVGCDTLSSAVSMDKITTKLLLASYGIPQARWTMTTADALEEEEESELSRIEKALGYPLFVKPAGTGSSRGVSRAADRAALSAALTLAAKYDKRILIEEEVSGSEVEVALLETVDQAKKKRLFASTPGEIVPDGGFYDYDAKYVKGTSLCRAPAEISESAARRVQNLAKIIFSALSCRSLSRADFFVKGEEIVFNEINTLPGFTSISMYPKLFIHDVLSYEALLDQLVETAILREKA